MGLRRSLSEMFPQTETSSGEADRSNGDAAAKEEDQNVFCTMECRNGGSCQLGRAIHGFASELLEDQDRLHVTAYSTSMHCVCPTGWTGLLCEVKLRNCPSTTHGCNNGHKCILSEDDFGKPFRHCECDGVLSDFTLPYAAHYCGQTATVFCSEDRMISGHSFCKNGGTCLGKITDAQQP